MTAELELATHLDVMGRWAVRQAFEDWVEDAWEAHCPDIGQHDFERILGDAEQLVPPWPAVKEFQEAYAFFEGRASA